MNIHNLVSESFITTESRKDATGKTIDGKTMCYYSFAGFSEEKPLSREEKKNKVKPTVGPVVMSKASFNDILGTLESIDENVNDMAYSKLVRLAEKKLAPGLSLWIAEQQPIQDKALAALLEVEDNDILEVNEDMDEDEKKEIEAHNAEITERLSDVNRPRPEFFRAVLGSVLDRVKELNKKQSVADPEAEVKRIFVKSDTYANLTKEGVDPQALVLAEIKNRREELDKLEAMAKTVLPGYYMAYLADKFSTNKLDKDGYVLLRVVEDKPEDGKIKGENS